MQWDKCYNLISKEVNHLTGSGETAIRSSQVPWHFLRRHSWARCVMVCSGAPQSLCGLSIILHLKRFALVLAWLVWFNSGGSIFFRATKNERGFVGTTFWKPQTESGFARSVWSVQLWLLKVVHLNRAVKSRYARQLNWILHASLSKTTKAAIRLQQ